MSNAIKELRDYLAKSPSVVYPQDVLEYLPAIEAENAKLREACAELLKMAERYDHEWLHWPEMHDELRELGVECGDDCE